MTERDRSIEDRAWRFSAQIGKTTLRLGLGLTESALTTLSGLLPAREHIRDRLRQSHVLHKAQVGVDIIEDGAKRKKAEDKAELLDIGAATVAKAVADAASDETVPDDVTQEVVDIAVEQAIDPYANPLVDDATAGQVRAAMEDFGPPPKH